MGSFRKQQVAELIRRHFSQVLQQEGRYLFEDALVTVTAVKMSPDLGLAKIYLSVYNTDDKQSLVLMMEGEKVRLRQALAARIRKQVRRIPDVDFYLDDTLDEMYRLNALFDKLHADNQMGSEEE
ncbi:MAG: 30S ribosome-binding factor RbfA [Saprospiraceae bacterium]|nr:30S ribosome-binding factor RbfA [Saprospiraceae bacterium]